jgi:excisionase family DNA binding protein
MRARDEGLEDFLADKPLLVSEVCAFLRYPRGRVLEMIASGELHALGAGRSLRVPRWSLDRALRQPRDL